MVCVIYVPLIKIFMTPVTLREEELAGLGEGQRLA